MEREQLIAKLYQEGWTLRGIAKQLGITPQRVHQIVKKLGLKPVTLSTLKAAEITGLSPATLYIALKQGKFEVERRPSGCGWLWKEEMVEELVSRRVCRVCGNKLPPRSRRRSFCSPECRTYAMNHRTRFFDKEKFREAMRRYLLKRKQCIPAST